MDKPRGFSSKFMPPNPPSTPTNTDVGSVEHGHKRRTSRSVRMDETSLQPAEFVAVEAPLVSSNVDDPGDCAESPPQLATTTPLQTFAAAHLSEGVGAWLPRVGASYLTRGPQGIWYLRWLVPVRLRACRPDLPRELRRSTETANKRLALGRARKMCLDFFTSAVNSGSTMQQPGIESRQSFRIVSVQPSHLDSPRSFDEGVHLFRRWTSCRRGRGRQGAGTQMS